MTTSETLATVQEVMADVFDLEPDDLSISESTTAEDVEEWDSLSHIRLMVALERRFNIKFSNAEIAGMKNVGDLVHKIDAKRA